MSLFGRNRSLINIKHQGVPILIPNLLSMDSVAHNDYQTSVKYWADEFIRHGIWDGPSIDDLELWLSNFTSIEEKSLACRLLDKLIFYSEKDIKTIISWCYDECLKQICVNELGTSHFTELIMSNPFALSNEWAKIRDCIEDKILLCPAATDSATASSYTILRKLIESKSLNDSKVCQMREVDAKLAQGKYKYLLLVDDVIGSGMQAYRNWTKTPILDKSVKKPLAQSVAEYGITGFQLVVAACYDGIQYLSKNSTLRVIAGEIVGEEWSTVNPNFWGKGGKDVLEAFKEFLNKKGVPLRGFERKSWTIAFHHDIPNVTCPVYFWEEKRWNPLVRRAKGD